MIGLILDLLRSDYWINTNSKWIELAKGEKELATDIRTGKRKLKRKWQSRK